MKPFSRAAASAQAPAPAPDPHITREGPLDIGVSRLIVGSGAPVNVPSQLGITGQAILHGFIVSGAIQGVRVLDANGNVLAEHIDPPQSFSITVNVDQYLSVEVTTEGPGACLIRMLAGEILQVS